MKVCIIQPYYSFNAKDTQDCYDKMVKMLDECDESIDLIVLPEYSDVPSQQENGPSGYYGAFMKYNADIKARAIAAAKRCNAIVFVNAAEQTENGWRNTTHAIDRQGNVVGKYFKAHPAPSEERASALGPERGIDVGYSYEFQKPYVLELEGIRFAFMTCYDFYFYENFAPIALQNVDVIIGCSHQRTDTHEALSIINRFLCYHTNAYLIRASVSLGEDSGICGCSCVIAPDGTELVNLKSRIASATCEIDVTKKYYKPAGFNGKTKSHYEYIEEGRRPWLYRNGGASVVPFDNVMKYPRICAHRGFNSVAPENSMPAFGAAVALGAEEIEFDIWSTKDNVLVSCHDRSLERVSDGVGKIDEMTYAELLKLDFGSKRGRGFAGLKIPTFEEILQKFSGRTIMNIHVKIWDLKTPNDMLDEIVALIRKYDCQKHCYFMTSNDDILKKIRKVAPDINVCVGWNGDKEDMLSMVNRAIELGAQKVQLFKPYFNKETVDYAHANGIWCNVFWSDDPEEARRYREMGIDTILTNDYLAIKNALENT